MPPTRGVTPKATLLSATNKGLAGPPPDNPHAQAPNEPYCGLAAKNRSKPPLVGDRCGTGEVTGMRDLSPPRQPAMAASMLHSTNHRGGHILFLHHAKGVADFVARRRPSSF